MLISDLALSRRLERTEAHANASFVESRARLAPATGATWTDVDGAWAMYDGVGSPLTQSFGIGLYAPATNTQIERLTRFFDERGADSAHEVSPLADAAALPLLAAHGYQVIEWTTVLAQELTHRMVAGEPSSALPVRAVSVHEAEHWSPVAAEGWGEQPELGSFMLDLGRVNARAEGTVCFLVEEHGSAIAAGSLHLHDGVALLSGASTIPRWRGRGAQRALLEARLQFAREHGCDLAMMGAAPGSGSQRNAQRAGFSVAYTRLKWARPHRA